MKRFILILAALLVLPSLAFAQSTEPSQPVAMADFNPHQIFSDQPVAVEMLLDLDDFKTNQAALLLLDFDEFKAHLSTNTATDRTVAFDEIHSRLKRLARDFGAKITKSTEYNATFKMVAKVKFLPRPQGPPTTEDVSRITISLYRIGVDNPLVSAVCSRYQGNKLAHLGQSFEEFFGEFLTGKKYARDFYVALYK